MKGEKTLSPDASVYTSSRPALAVTGSGKELGYFAALFTAGYSLLLPWQIYTDRNVSIRIAVELQFSTDGDVSQGPGDPRARANISAHARLPKVNFLLQSNSEICGRKMRCVSIVLSAAAHIIILR